MNSFAVIAFFACLAATNAGLHHGSSAHVIQGPSSRTTVVGPEGSVISAAAPGGQIVHEEHPGVIAHAAPVHSVAYATHGVAHQAPVHHAVSYTAHVAPVAYATHHAAPATVLAHSSAYGHGNALVARHYGTISTTHGHHVAPVAYAAHHAAPATVLAHTSAYGHGNALAARHYGTISTTHGHHVAPLAYTASHYAAPIVAHGYGHERQYAHDFTESLYDDGSYNPHAY